MANAKGTETLNRNGHPRKRAPNKPKRVAVGNRLGREPRIQHIARLMRDMVWRPKMAVDLAIHWGLSTEMVQQDAAEASRIIAREIKDPDRMVAAVGTRLENVILSGTNKEAINAAAISAKLLGLNAPTKLEVSNTTPLILSEEWAALRRILGEAIQSCPVCSSKVVEAIKLWEGLNKSP